jgi:hypothetical protein
MAKAVVVKALVVEPSWKSVFAVTAPVSGLLHAVRPRHHHHVVLHDGDGESR